jgi:peptidoglycan/LPS O-acetylase OafA/YrhL
VPALDGLRGIAVLAVLLHHLFRFAPDSPVGEVTGRVSAAGYMGVDLFFVLSGFLITGILVSTRTRADYFTRFYWRRTLRIFPLYYAVLLFVFLVFRPLAARFTELSPVAGEPAAYFLYLSNFAIAAAGDFSWRPTDITWSLAVEEQFYLVFPLLVRWIPPRRLIAACLVLILGAIAARTFLFVQEGSRAWIDCYVLPFTRMDALCLGALLACVARTPEALTGRGLRWLSDVALLALPFVALSAWSAHAHPFMMTVGRTVVALAMVSLVRRAAQTPVSVRNAFTVGPLVYLGNRSYGIYLLHSLVEGVLRRAPGVRSYFTDVRVEQELLPALAFFVASCAITIGLAECSFQWLERPLLALKDRARVPATAAG